MINWSKDRDGVYRLLIDPDSTITNGFKFVFGNDTNCDPITISSFTITTQNNIEVISSILSGGDTITVQTKGCGEIVIIMTLSNTDIRRAIRRYTESMKSKVFS